MDVSNYKFNDEEIVLLKKFRDLQQDARLRIRFIALLMLALGTAIDDIAAWLDFEDHEDDWRVIAGGAMRAVFESVGVKDVLAKSKGSSNPHSVVKATIDALSRLRDPKTIAQLRGVELDKIFNG